MPERERPHVVQALTVPCNKGGTAIISVWSDGARTCSNYESRVKSRLEGLLDSEIQVTVCNSCPAKNPNHYWRMT